MQEISAEQAAQNIHKFSRLAHVRITGTLFLNQFEKNEIHLEAVEVARLCIQGTRGNITLHNVKITQSLEVERSSGALLISSPQMIRKLEIGKSQPNSKLRVNVEGGEIVDIVANATGVESWRMERVKSKRMTLFGFCCEVVQLSNCQADSVEIADSEEIQKLSIAKSTGNVWRIVDVERIGKAVCRDCDLSSFTIEGKSHTVELNSLNIRTGPAQSAENSRIVLQECECRERARIESRSVARLLECREVMLFGGAQLTGSFSAIKLHRVRAEEAFLAQNIKVEQNFDIRDSEFDGGLNLDAASIGAALSFSEDTEVEGRLNLNKSEIAEIHFGKAAIERLDWSWEEVQQRSQTLTNEEYVSLSASYRLRGRHADADKAQIEAHRARYRAGTWAWAKVEQFFLDWLLGYCCSLWRLLRLGLFLIVIYTGILLSFTGSFLISFKSAVIIVITGGAGLETTGAKEHLSGAPDVLIAILSGGGLLYMTLFTVTLTRKIIRE